MKKTTIYKIAREAEVSVTTVSRFFNNPGLVKKSTRNKISEICKKYDFRPSSIASAITTKKTKTVAILVPSFKEPAFVELMGGAEYVFSRKGYCLSVFNARQSIERELEIANIIDSRFIDGVILSGVYGNEKDKVFISEMLKRNIPCIMTDRIIPDIDIPYVGSNEYLGGKLAADHVLDNGHHKIGIITYPLEVHIFSERIRGNLDALKSRKQKESFIFEVPLEFGKIESSIRSFIDKVLDKRPSVILTTSDSIAFFIIRIMRERGVSIPEDISIMGYDNIIYSSLVTPSLSTIHHDMEEIGKVVATNLLYRIENGEYLNMRQIIDPRLLPRESVIDIRQKEY